MKSQKNMSTTLVIALGLVSFFSTSAQAVTLFCLASAPMGISDDDSNSHNLLREQFVASCGSADIAPQVEDLKLTRFLQDVSVRDITMTLNGVGPGFRVSESEVIMVNCPLVFKTENLMRSSFKGVKVSASAILGGSAGVFMNQRLGICVLTSLSTGLGVGVSGASLRFEK